MSVAVLRRLAAPLLLATLALLPAGCDLGGDTDAPQLVYQFAIPNEAPPPPGTPPAVDVGSGQGAGIVSLQGTFVRTCAQGAPRVSYALEGTTLTFRATYTPPAGCSSETPARQLLRYYAYLTGVPAGQYQVRVVHEGDESAGGSATVLEETLTIN